MATDADQYPEQDFDLLARWEQRHWWFAWRNLILLRAFRRFAPRLHSYLEVGCGTGFVLRGISDAYPNARLMAAELHLAGIGIAKRRVPRAIFEQMDVRSMTSSDEFDAIGAFDVIEHIREDQLVLRNFHHALKATGTLFISVPQHPALWSAFDEHAMHQRRYTRAELFLKLEAAGFKIVYATSFVTTLLPVMWAARRRSNANKTYDPAAELRVNPSLNASLYLAMAMDYALIMTGMSLPFGGSLLVVARKQ